jgi:hypothetical protein
MRWIALGTLVLAMSPLVPSSGCAPQEPSYRRSHQSAQSIPIVRSKRELASNITYYLASIRQDGSEVIVDLDVTNGHSQSFSFATLWVTLLGPGERKRIVEHPMGPFGQHRTEHAVVRARGVGFQVEDVQVSIQVR